MKKRIAASALAALLAVTSFTGCGASSKSKNLVEDIKPNPVPVYKSFDKNEQENVAEFAAQIIRNTESENGNIVVSPVSVLYALAMTANGADAQTLAQMEYVFGMDIQTLNDYLHSTVSVLPSDEGYTLDIANSLWITNNEGKFVVNKDFLRVVKSYYDAGIFSADFANKGTVNDINDWVTRQTNGQIQNILDKVDPNAVMYLVNAINFEAEWLKTYTKNDVHDGIFTHEDGSTQDAEFMHMSEYAYLEDENTTGFIKYYKGEKYAFVGLLPAENIKMQDYLDNLSGEKITNLLKNVSQEKVLTKLPKYEVTYGTEMSEIFKNLGMTDAFSFDNADFTKMGQATENVAIDKIIHKAFIRVAEEGTQAGAATVVGMLAGSAAPGKPPKEVYLDRPFVYMIIDTENNLPLFMGTVCEIE